MKITILLCTALIALTCQISQAQENKKFLDEYFLGGNAEQSQLVSGIDELVVAREVGRQAVLLSRCTNYKTLDTKTGFDSYSEDLQKVLSEKSPSFNALNGHQTLFLAAARNEFSDDDIRLLKVLMARPDYADLMSYSWFETAMRQLTEGLIDINTDTKQPWVAAKAIRYLKSHKLYPLFLSTLSDPEKELLNQEVFTSLQPAVISKETQYTEALSLLFQKQLESKTLLRSLPVVTAAGIVGLQKGINPEGKQAAGALVYLEEDSALVCKSSAKANCVTNDWFKQAKATFKLNESERLNIAKALLRDKHVSLCDRMLN